MLALVSVLFPRKERDIGCAKSFLYTRTCKLITLSPNIGSMNKNYLSNAADKSDAAIEIIGVAAREETRLMPVSDCTCMR